MKSILNALIPSFLVVILATATACGSSEPEPEVKPLGNIDPVTPAAAASKNNKKKSSYSLMGNSFEAAEEALNNDDYEKAAKILIQMQLSGKVQNSKDGWRYSSLMTELQSVLASAAGDGDKKAQRTIEMLRQSRGPM